jgi:hypothetical protein
MHRDDDVLRVLAHQRRLAAGLERDQANQARATDAAIASTEALLREVDCYRACLLMPEGRIARRLVDGDCPSASGIALTEADWSVAVSMM